MLKRMEEEERKRQEEEEKRKQQRLQEMWEMHRLAEDKKKAEAEKARI